MHPICLTLGPLTIHWYGVMMALGFLAGLLSWLRLGRRDGRDFNFVSDLLFWIMVSGILGARLAYILSEFGYFLKNPLLVIRIDQGGLIYYGGLVGAGLAIILFAKTRRENVGSLFDFVVTSLPLAHAFGRIGCFLNACCYGSLSAGPLAVSYPAGTAPWIRHTESCPIRCPSSAARSLTVHPIQLYEAAFNLFLYLLLLRSYRRRKGCPGSLTALYLLVYPPGRIALEFLRGDPRMTIAGVSVAQAISVALFVCGIILWIWTWRRPHEAPSRPL